MSQDFGNALDRVTGTSPVTVHTSDSNDTIIGFRCTNVLAQLIKIDVYIVKSAANYYIAKDLEIPAGSSVELMQGGAKMVIVSGDAVTVVSDTAASLDTIVSLLDAISA